MPLASSNIKMYGEKRGLVNTTVMFFGTKEKIMK